MFLDALSAVPRLGAGPALALDAFRLMATGSDECGLVARFDDEFGFAGRAALGAMHLLVREIGMRGCRRMTIACPGCCRLTDDEWRILALLGAAQARDVSRVDFHLSCLFAGRGSETARAAALALGGLFRAVGRELDGPALEIRSPTRPPHMSLVHSGDEA
ncbi:MAG: hypothetical protein ACK4NP_08830 [Parvularculaceae bacterium]